MTAPANFTKYAHRAVRDLVLLVKITLAAPSAATIYAATRPIEADGTFWQPLITKAGPFRYPGDWLTSDPSLCEFDVSFASGAKVGFQPNADTLEDLLPAYQFDATARVDAWLVAVPDSAQWQVDIADALPLFVEGEIVSVDSDGENVSLVCRQRSDFNRPVLPTVTDREKYPNCPEANLGIALPILIGSHGQERARAPWINAFSNFWSGGGSAIGNNVPPFYLGGRKVIPGVVVDYGRGAGDARVLVASHALKRIGDVANGAGAFIKEGEGLSLVQEGTFTTFNAADGAGILLSDAALAWLPVRAGEVEVIPNTADDFRAILEPTDVSFVQFDTAGGKTKLRVRFRQPTNPGEMSQVPPAFIVGFAYELNGGALQAVLHNQATGLNSGAMLLLESTPARPTTIYFSLGVNGVGQVLWGVTPLPSTAYNLSDLYLEVTATSGKPRLYSCGIGIKHRPKQEVIESTREVTVMRQRAIPGKKIGDRPRGGVFAPYAERQTIPAVTEMRSNLFFNAEGWADETPAKFTDTAASLVEAFPDAMTLMLVEYGKQPLANIERGVGVHGSFVDARSTLKTWRDRPMRAALSIRENTDVQSAMGLLAAGAVSWAFISPHDGKWKLVPWQPGAAARYPLKFRREHLTSLRARRMPNTSIASSVRLPFAVDADTRQPLYEAIAGDGKSQAAYDFLGIRDQSLKVSAAVNDRLDVGGGIGAGTFTLSAGDHDYSTLYADLRRLNSTAFRGQRWGFAIGGVTYAGANTITVTDGTTYNVTLPAGVRTMEGHAAAWQAAIRAATGNNSWTVTYSRTTRLFTFTRPSGGGTPSLRFHADAPTIADNACAGLGFRPLFYNMPGPGFTVSSEFPLEEEFFALACQNTFDLLLRTGPNGFTAATPRHCGSVIGFDARRDYSGAGWYVGQCPKGYLEKLLAAASLAYRSKRDAVIPGDAIGDAETAREAVKRVGLLMSAIDRQEVEFSTPYAFDCERAMDVEFDADCDALEVFPKFGGGGTWAGHTFRVVNRAIRFDREWVNDFVAVQM